MERNNKMIINEKDKKYLKCPICDKNLYIHYDVRKLESLLHCPEQKNKSAFQIQSVCNCFDSI